MSVDQMGCATANSIGFTSINQGLFNVRIIGEAKVIVTAKIQDFVTIDNDLLSLSGFCHPSPAVQPLLLKLV